MNRYPQDPEMVEIEVWVHVDEDAALLVSLPEDNSPKVWLPKSLIKVTAIHQVSKRTSYAAEITLPEWLANDRGLI